MKRKSGSNSSNSSFLSKDLADPNLMYMLLFVLILLVVLNLNTGNKKGNNKSNGKSSKCYSPLMCDNSQNILPGKNDDNNDYNNYGKFKEGFATTQPETTQSGTTTTQAEVTEADSYKYFSDCPSFEKLSKCSEASCESLKKGGDCYNKLKNYMRDFSDETNACKTNPIFGNIPMIDGMIANYNDTLDIKKCGEIVSNYEITKEALLPEGSENKNILELQCASLVNKSVAFRHYNTGVTFKKEQKGNSNEYFIYGPQGKVLTVPDTSNNLSFEIKSVESNNKQLFKQIKITDTANVPGIGVDVGKELCYFTPKTDTNRALQYEHGHLTLRNLYNQNTGTKLPFSGQLFIETDEDINTDGIHLGLSKANIEHHHLGDHLTSNIDLSSQRNLELETQTRNQEILNQIVGKLDNLDIKSGTMSNNGQENTQSVDKGNLTFNVDFSGLDLNNIGTDSVSGFKDTFADSASQTLTMKEQIDAYERRKRMKAQRENSSNNRSNLRFNFNPSGISNDTIGRSVGNLGLNSGSTGILNTGNANKVFRCPSLNRDDYYRDDQLAQCYGCNPDNSLR